MFVHAVPHQDHAPATRCLICGQERRAAVCLQAANGRLHPVCETCAVDYRPGTRVPIETIRARRDALLSAALVTA